MRPWPTPSAAIAQVGGEMEQVFNWTRFRRQKRWPRRRPKASQRVLAEGAVPDSVTIVDIDEVPLTYLPGNATRIRVKAVGTLELT
ncbi:MAG: hypothetical protein R2854_21960 [Caldilineaceae bacterium]